MSFGLVAMFIQLAIVLWGLPHQIWSLHRAKNADTLSIPLHLLMWAGSVAYGVHAAVEFKDIYVLWPQIPAVIFGAVLTVQIVYYRSRSAGTLARA